jgi:hypothetical protein
MDALIVGSRLMQAPAGSRWLPPVRPVPAKAVCSRPALGGLDHEYTIAT